MSKAPRPATWKTRSSSWAGQVWWLGQRRSLSPSFSCTSVVPHDGHLVGIFHARRPWGRSGSTGPRISGITSPALRRMTVSPGRTSLRSTSWALCSVALLDGRAGHLGRLHHAERRHPAGAADVDPDVEQLGVDLLGRVLERDRPARRPARRAQPTLEADVVDLDHDAVDLVGDVVTVLAVRSRCTPRRPRAPSTTFAGRRSAGPRPSGRRRRGTAPRPRSPRGAPMPWQTMPRARVAVTLGSFWRSEPAAALRGLANIGLPASTIDSLSRSKASTGRNTSPRTSTRAGTGNSSVPLEPVRDRVDRLDVGRDVLAGAAVAAGQRADQSAVLVEQVDGQAVDLELAEVCRVVDAVAGQPRGPALELVVGEGVVEALHPLEVVDRRELRGDRATDLLRRAVGGAQVGHLLLERLETPHPLVEVGVGQRRVVEHVVAPPRVLDLLGQRPVLLALVGLRIDLRILLRSLTAPSCPV